MADKMIFADDLTACPRCGSELFWWNFTDDSEDKELMLAECVVCGTSYYGRNYYQQRLARIKADNKKKIVDEKE